MPPTVALRAVRLAVLAALLSPAWLEAQVQKPDSQPAAAAKPDSQPAPAVKADSQPPKPKPWYERVTIGGFFQARYNQVLQTNELLVCQACDVALGGVPKFSFREARLVVRAAPVDRVAVVVEADLTQVVGTSQLILQLRELFGDLFVDKEKETILRIGFARVPYGYENLQSSAVRLPFDRDDAIASGAPGERDIGIWGIWAPAKVHQEFRMLVDSLFKGAADYGVVSVGIYNGQIIQSPGTEREQAHRGARRLPLRPAAQPGHCGGGPGVYRHLRDSHH